MNWKEIFKIEQNATLTLASVVVYLSVATMVGEYIISRETPVLLQLIVLFLMALYTVWQIRYIVRYLIKLFNV
jgi:hypothetical protein